MTCVWVFGAGMKQAGDRRWPGGWERLLKERVSNLEAGLDGRTRGALTWFLEDQKDPGSVFAPG